MTETKQIAKLQKLAITLLTNKQITRKHCRLILEVNKDTDVVYVRKLIALTEDLLRVKGYYHSVERINACDKAIDEWITIQSQ